MDHSELFQQDISNAINWISDIVENGDLDSSEISRTKLKDMGDAAVPLLRLLVTDGTYSNGLVAADALVGIASPASLTAIGELLTENKNGLTMAYVWVGLSNIGQSAVPYLLPLLQHPDLRVVNQAIRTLEQIGDASAIVPLLNVLIRPASKWEQPEETPSAIGAVASFGNDALIPVNEMFEAMQNFNVRRSLLHILGRIDTADSIGALRRLGEQHPEYQPIVRIELFFLGDEAADTSFITDDLERTAPETSRLVVAEIVDRMRDAHWDRIIQSRTAAPDRNPAHNKKYAHHFDFLNEAWQYGTRNNLLELQQTVAQGWQYVTERMAVGVCLDNMLQVDKTLRLCAIEGLARVDIVRSLTPLAAARATDLIGELLLTEQEPQILFVADGLVKSFRDEIWAKAVVVCGNEHSITVENFYFDTSEMTSAQTSEQYTKQIGCPVCHAAFRYFEEPIYNGFTWCEHCTMFFSRQQPYCPFCVAYRHSEEVLIAAKITEAERLGLL